MKNYFLGPIDIFLLRIFPTAFFGYFILLSLSLFFCFRFSFSKKMTEMETWEFSFHLTFELFHILSSVRVCVCLCTDVKSSIILSSFYSHCYFVYWNQIQFFVWGKVYNNKFWFALIKVPIIDAEQTSIML